MTLLETLHKAHAADPVGTEALIDEVVYGLIAEEGEALRPVLARAQGAVVAQRVAVAKRALARQYAGSVVKGSIPGEEVQRAAAWLNGIERFVAAVVSKADGDLSGADLATFNQKHKRDARGRFTRGVSQTARRAPEQYADRRRVARPVSQTMQAGSLEGKRAESERMQAQYEEAERIIQDFAAGFGRGDRGAVNARLVLQDSSGNIKTKDIKLSDAVRDLQTAFEGNNAWALEDSLIGVEIEPSAEAGAGTIERVNQFNTLGGLGGMKLAQINALEPGQRSRFAQSLMPRGPEQSRLGAFFDRVRGATPVLEGTGNEKLAALSRFVGEMGPEATRVLEPRFQQAAYRYRGTEKEPDLALMSVFNGAEMGIVDEVAKNPRGVDSRNITGDTPEMGSLKFHLEEARRTGEPLTEDQVRMRVRSDVAAQHLISKLPLDRMVSQLSQAAGNILPSQGVLIDADGDVVSQAVGFGDDTYLPFNYANLRGRLRGGQYVRTRVQGGLTGEDIAAAVGHGARMATVASSSGVFSIEFDPNLRGARGMSDKANSMFERYLKILDAVDKSGLYVQDVDARTKSRVRAEAAALVGTSSGPEFDAASERLLEEERSKATVLSEEEQDQLLEQAEQAVMSNPRAARMDPRAQQRMVDDMYEDLEAEARSKKASRLRLNSEGYKVALETLQQQFPYFIRNVSYQPLAQQRREASAGFLDSRGQRPQQGTLRQRSQATDQGYVAPGGLRARSVQSGFYSVDRGMQPKREEKPAREPTLGAGAQTEAQAAASGQASGQAPGQVAVGAVGAPPKGLRAQLTAHGVRAQEQRTKALGDLSAEWLKVAGGAARTQGNFEDVAGNPTALASWFFSQTQAGMMQALNDPAKSGAVIRALRDRTAVKAALESAFSGSEAQGPDDFFAGGKRLMGASSFEEAGEAFADAAQVVADAGAVANPFVDEVSEGGEFHAGDRPQNLKLAGGVTVDSLDTPEKLQAVLRRDPDLAAAATALGMDANGYLPASEVAQRVGVQVSALRQVPALQKAIAARRASSGMQEGLSSIATDVTGGVGTDKLLAGLQAAGIDPTPDAVLAVKDSQQRARRLQEAWAVVNAARSLELLRGPEGGGVLGPKGLAGQLLRLEPAEPVVKFVGRSTARVRVVKSDSSSLSRAIRARRAAGMPVVPTRV